MEKDLLQAVIKVEKEIQDSIEAEKKKAADWLESVRIAASLELENKKQQLLDHYDQSLGETCQLSQHKAEQEIAEVNRMAEYLLKLPVEIAEDVVTEYLPAILPDSPGAEQ